MAIPNRKPTDYKCQTLEVPPVTSLAIQSHSTDPTLWHQQVSRNPFSSPLPGNSGGWDLHAWIRPTRQIPDNPCQGALVASKVPFGPLGRLDFVHTPTKSPNACFTFFYYDSSIGDMSEASYRAMHTWWRNEDKKRDLGKKPFITDLS